ncbi:axonemal dynein light chain domain-containing protein 1 [Polymixia lowei]
MSASRVELPELKQRAPAERPRKKQPLPLQDSQIPEELLASLTSTVRTSNTLGPADHKHSKGHGIPRPDAVWHYPLGREKYGFFLRQPTSLTGAGRDFSFLCDAMATQRKRQPLPPTAEWSGDAHRQDSVTEGVISEEYHIVKNKGVQGLDFYDDKFTVQLQDDQQRLRLFPPLSRRPSGRLEAVKLLTVMDDMLEKAGFNQQSEDVPGLSPVQALLELVREEQIMYNVVFHEVIRQVTVQCAERGQLLAKLRQGYVSLLDRIPRKLKGLHTETLALRALNRRLAEEITCFKTSILQLSRELSEIRDHDELVSKQAERSQQDLAKTLDQTQKTADLVQKYHDLYEMQRQRLEGHVTQLTEERDVWINGAYSLAVKVIRLKKLQLASRLHVSQQTWSKTAKHFTVLLSSKDSEDLNVIVQLTDSWREQLTSFMSTLRETEHAQCEQIRGVQEDMARWLAFCSAHNRRPDPKYEKVSEEEIYADLKQWSHTLTVQCERYMGEQLLSCQETLEELGRLQETWVEVGLQLFRRHPAPDGGPPRGQEALRELGTAVSELHTQLETRVSGENGIHYQTMSTAGLMESWATKLRAVIGQPDGMHVSDWLRLEKALNGWQSVVEEVLQNVSSTQPENEKAQNKPHVKIEMEDVFDTMLEFITSQSNFFDCDNCRLCEEVGFLHTAMTRWMVDLLILMVPDHEPDPPDASTACYSLLEVSLDKLEEDARTLAQKLDYFSTYITSSCQLILEEELQKNLRQDGADSKVYERSKLQPSPASATEVLVSPATSLESLGEPSGHEEEVEAGLQGEPSGREEEVEAGLQGEPSGREEEVEAGLQGEPSGREEEVEAGLQGEPSGREEEVEAGLQAGSVLKLIGYDGNITEGILGESSILLDGEVFDVLATVGLLQRELRVAEARVQSSEQRALKAEEALQEALVKIQELERQQSQSSLKAEVLTAPEAPAVSPVYMSLNGP